MDTIKRLLDCDFTDSSDSDYIANYGSNDDDCSVESTSEGSDKSLSENVEDNSAKDFLPFDKNSVAAGEFDKSLKKLLICCICLKDQSDDENEIVECDNCGVSVHEGCYGLSDAASNGSTNTTCDTMPWFCEPCCAGVVDPTCELCPNKGGIFKETDVGKWVHLVCALSIPGISFGDTDKLSSLTLFEMDYTKWGAKACSLCEDLRFARVGVCVGCDAGLCKSYFHITCAQAHGLLIADASQAPDCFYVQCKTHSNQELVKKLQRSYNAICAHMQQKEKQTQRHEDLCPEQVRIKRHLLKHQRKYKEIKSNKPEPWVPTQKMARPLTSSASFVRRIQSKARAMSVDLDAIEQQETQIASLRDIHKKWHVAPALDVEFVTYYHDRFARISDLQQQISEKKDDSKVLGAEQSQLRQNFEMQQHRNEELKEKKESLTSAIALLHQQISALAPNQVLPNAENINRMLAGHTEPETLLLCAASKSDETSATLLECSICKCINDQHLLVKCDTCLLHYHLACLYPPLTRHPKKSKVYDWQCSECGIKKGSELLPDVPKGPRKPRTRFNRDGSIMTPLHLE